MGQGGQALHVGEGDGPGRRQRRWRELKGGDLERAVDGRHSDAALHGFAHVVQAGEGKAARSQFGRRGEDGEIKDGQAGGLFSNHVSWSCRLVRFVWKSRL